MQMLSTNRIYCQNCRPASPSSPSLGSTLNFSNDELLQHSEYLHYESEIKTANLNKQRELKQQEEDSLCTFHPEIHNTKLSQGLTQGYLTEKPIRYSMRESRESDDYECTFMPSFISQQRKGVVKQQPIRQTELNDINKRMNQIQQARTVRHYLQKAFERSPETIPKNPLVKKGQYFNKKSKSPKKKSPKNSLKLQNLKKHKQEPISIAEVHLSPTESEKIYIYPGDTSSELATKFAAQYSLDDKMKGKLQEMLEQKILQNI